MKWYNQSVAKMHRDSMTKLPRRIKDNDPTLYRLLKWVPKLIININREYAAIGGLDINDLIAIGNECLLVALERSLRLNDPPLDEVPENERAANIWAYVKRSIELDVRKAIALEKDGIRAMRLNNTPKVERKTGKVAEENFVTQLFPDFFNTDWVKDAEHNTYEDIRRLGDGLNKVMDMYLKFDEQKLLKMYYGLDMFDKHSLKNLQDVFHKGASAIKKMKQRAVDKMRNDECKKILQNYYDF